MSQSRDPDSIHRLAKQAIDSGAASTIEEAEELLRSYKIRFVITEQVAADRSHQVALLTGVALARRVFLGGVEVIGTLNVPLAASTELGETLADAVKALGGISASDCNDIPIVYVGGEPVARSNGFAVRTVFSGWRGGTVPAHTDICLANSTTIPLSPMLAAALSVNEAFGYVQGDRAAGKKAIGISLWRPAADDWLTGSNDGPPLQYLPSRLWLIGLGHLGQAYLWALGLLPYPDPSAVLLILQDIDRITDSTESTSILTDSSMVGQKKTRAMAQWAEQRGFSTVIYERPFDASFQRRPDEPSIALCGIDNAEGRRALDKVGFPLVIEAGLGRGHSNFRSIRLHTLPGHRPAAELWKSDGKKEDLTDRAAYQRMLKDGTLDQCGVTLLAGKAVGAPFVGSVAACLVLSEVLRLLHEGELHSVIDLDLRSVEHRSVVARHHSLPCFNPGFVHIAH